MKTIALLQLLLLPLASLLNDVPRSAAQETSDKPSATCSPWSANYWGDARITTQAEANEYLCFRRVVGSLTLIQSGGEPIVMPKLQGVIGDLRIVFASATRAQTVAEPARALAQGLPSLEDVTGHIALEYSARSVLPSAAVSRAERAAIRISR